MRAALPSVIDRKGYVLIVSSAAAYLAAAGMAPYNASKAAVEHFTNALRLEVAHLRRRGRVGAHVVDRHPARPRKQRPISATAREMIDSLPGALGKITSVDKCAAAFVKGIEGRKPHINCPGWVGLFRWLKPLLSSPAFESQMAKRAADQLPKMDAEARRSAAR